MVGRSDLLKKKEEAENPMAAKVDLSAILENPYLEDKDQVIFQPDKAMTSSLRRLWMKRYC